MSWLLVALLGGALASAQMFFGGVHMVHAQIAYACLGVAGAISAILWGRRRTTPDAACVAATLAFLGYVALRAALSPVPSWVNVPTCISYNIWPAMDTPVHSWSVQVNSPGSTISDGPCGPFGWKRDAGSG